LRQGPLLVEVPEDDARRGIVDPKSAIPAKASRGCFGEKATVNKVVSGARRRASSVPAAPRAPSHAQVLADGEPPAVRRDGEVSIEFERTHKVADSSLRHCCQRCAIPAAQVLLPGWGR
jgi:hypothetical protein